MKRDWDLVKQIMLKVEDLEDTRSRVNPCCLSPGYDTELVSYHLQLLGEAGLLLVECSQPMGAPLVCFGKSLTWSGHEFLDSIRSEKVWNRICKTAREKGLELSFGVIKAIAEGVTKGLL